MNDIIDSIGLPAVLEQLAEECSELAQASLKYARLLRGENPTPKSERQCVADMTEEVADVNLCLSQLFRNHNIRYDDVIDIIEFKNRRWHERIQEAHHEEQ